MRIALWGAVVMLALVIGCGPTERLSTDEGEFAFLGLALQDSCPDRDINLVKRLKDDGPDGGMRACNHDDNCPWGSFCNLNTGLCDYKCLPGSDAGDMSCPSGQTCNCAGQCVTSGSPGVVGNKTQLPIMRVQPGFVEFNRRPTDAGTTDAGTDWPHEEIVVQLIPPQGTTDAGGLANTRVHVTAGYHAQVQCPLADGGTTLPSESCDVQTWDPTSSLAGAPLRATVNVRPIQGTPLKSWDFVFDSDDTTPHRLRVAANLGLGTDSAGQPVREYGGYLTLTLGQENADVGLNTLRLPVRAWANNDTLLIVDASRTLSPTGKVRLRVSSTPQRYTSAWLTALPGSPSNVDEIDSLQAEVQGFLPTAPIDSDLLGNFSILLPQPVAGASGSLYAVSVSYLLSQVQGAPMQFCASNACTQSGYVCEPDVGVCVPGPRRWASIAKSNPTNTILSEKRQKWFADGNQKLTEALQTYGLAPWQLAEGLVCNQGTATSSATLDLRGFKAGDILSQSGDLRCAVDSPPYVSELYTQQDRYDQDSPYLLDNTALLKECLADLERLPTVGPPTDVSGWLQERLKAVTPLAGDSSGKKTPERCISQVRLFSALNLSARQANSRDQRLAWRLMQQWIGVHSFLAQRVAQEQEAKNLLGVSDTPWPDMPTWVSTPELDKMLAAYESAWKVLLDEAYLGLMPGNEATSTCALLSPDYRTSPKPVASWRGNGVAIRPNQPWQRSSFSVLYSDPNWENTCRSTGSSTLPLFELAASGNGSSGYSHVDLWGECRTATPGTARLGIQRKEGESAYDVFTAAVPVSVANNTLGLIITSNPATGPTSRVFAQENTTLLSSSRVTTPEREGPPTIISSTSTLAAWDFALDAQQAAAVLSEPSVYVLPHKDADPPVGHLPHHPQGLGLPTTIVEGVTAHLRLLNARLEEAESKGLTSCTSVTAGSDLDAVLARAGRTLRYAVTLEALATAAREREVARCAPGLRPPASEHWDKARAELVTVRNDTYQRIRALNDCKPQGVPEDEAPLYFALETAQSPAARFFGSSSELFYHAQKALTDAKQDLVTARQAWLQARSGDVLRQTTTSQREAYVLGLRKQYGQTLIDLCGLSGEQPENMLYRFDPEKPVDPFSRPALRPETCFVRQGLECKVLASQLGEAMTQGQARHALCIWKQLEGAGTYSSTIQAAANGYASAEVVVGTTGPFVHSGGQILKPEDLYTYPFDVTGLPPEAMRNAETRCSELLSSSSPLPAPSDIGRSMGTCYQGRMGAAALGIIMAQQNLQAARSMWAEKQEQFSAAYGLCQLEAESQTKKALLRQHHFSMLEALGQTRARVEKQARMWSVIGNAVESITSGAVGGARTPQSGLSATGGLLGAAGGLLSLPFKIFEANRQDKLTDIRQQVEKKELEFQQKMQAEEDASRVKACMVQASVHLGGIRTAAYQVERAETEAHAALLELMNLERSLVQTLQEGRSVVAQEEAREVPLLSHHFWLDESIHKARKSFEWSKRLAYLFSLALEYEKQLTDPASFEARRKIAAAQGPMQLDSALRSLDLAVLDKKVHGREPDGHTFTLSLREHVLGIHYPLEGEPVPPTPAGERPWNAHERFARRLLGSESAVYDHNGMYLGQGVRFTFPEHVYPASCAERVWRVSANIKDRTLPGASLTSYINNNNGNLPLLMLYKRNTFAQHWCDDDGFQVRAARPSTRIENPDSSVVEAEGDLFTVARLFSSIEYSPGSAIYPPQPSNELRGRGLYGEYMLVFPWNELLSTSVGTRPRFPLEGVADVQLTLEVVSVAQSSEQPPPDACEPTSCALAGKGCGMISVGCGRTLDCGTCAQGWACATDNTCVCQPRTTCIPGECGDVPDGCGGFLSCNTCGAGEMCDNFKNVCVCKPRTTCNENECGVVPDGCGGQLECGGCSAGHACQNNQCVCQPRTYCRDNECGLVPDGCGGTITCGGCGVGEVCNANHVCECVPRTSCNPGECGDVPNGCGGTIPCNSCPAGKMCDFPQKQCVCAPRACRPGECGVVANGCGGTMNCGGCGSGKACVNNSCCQPETCQSLGAECGEISDGCGGTLWCGGCGINGFCNGDNTCFCQPLDCEGRCGRVSNGCGGTMWCGICTPIEP